MWAVPDSPLQVVCTSAEATSEEWLLLNNEHGPAIVHYMIIDGRSCIQSIKKLDTSRVKASSVRTSFDIADTLKLLIDGILIPANWDSNNPFVLCCTMDGTRKQLLNAVIAGFKFCKDATQNLCWFDRDTGKIHSESFYLPLCGALCKETSENSHKYFSEFFAQMRDIEHNGIAHRGQIWKFDILLCTDLKAHWALLNRGGPCVNDMSCCAMEKAFIHTPDGVCVSCQRRDPERTTACIHEDMHLRTKSGDIEMPWTVPEEVKKPPKKQSKGAHTCVAALAEVEAAEIEKAHNVELINVQLLKRFETDKKIAACMTSLQLNTRHALMRHCHKQERLFMWLQSERAVAELAMWVDRMTTIPDLLHMELRVGEEMLTQIFQVFVMNRTDILPQGTKTAQQVAKSAILTAVSATVGGLISNNNCSNFTIMCMPKEPEIIMKIGMNNDRLRRVFNGMEQVIMTMFTEDERVTHSSMLDTLRRVTSGWIAIRDAFRTDVDFSVDQADALQDRIDVWMIDYYAIFPTSGGCYLHMLYKGHMRDYLIIHKNLHRWCNVDSEAHNGFLKHVLSHRCQMNGHKGGKRGVDDDSEKHVEHIATCMMRMYMRRIMWLFDPTVSRRLDHVKATCPYPLKQRDVLTIKTGDSNPKTYVFDEHHLLSSLYAHLPAIYVHNTNAPPIVVSRVSVSSRDIMPSDSDNDDDDDDGMMEIDD